MNVILTGASRGIGLEMLQVLVSSGGHKIIVLTRNIAPLKQFDYKESLRCISFDVSTTNQSEELDMMIKSFFNNKVDIVINNAGILINKPVGQFDEKEYDSIFDTNVKGLFFLVQQLLPCMNNPSHIVNITSMGGYQGSAKFAGLSLYSASKGAVSILTECMAEELKSLGISVNALALGAVDTDMLRQAFPGYKAPVSASQMAQFIINFALTGHRVFNGKILPVSLSVP